MFKTGFPRAAVAFLLATGQLGIAMAAEQEELRLGAQLITEHRCAECHARKVGGDGSSVYRPGMRLNDQGQLRGMVEQCNTELNMGMFPEEVAAVARVLNQRYYRFR